MLLAFLPEFLAGKLEAATVFYRCGGVVSAHAPPDQSPCFAIDFVFGNDVRVVFLAEGFDFSIPVAGSMGRCHLYEYQTKNDYVFHKGQPYPVVRRVSVISTMTLRYIIASC